MTVQDQIRLWELERNRIKTQEGKPGNLLELVNTFESFTRFDLLLTWVQVSCTPRSLRKPTTNMSSNTRESLMSCYGKTPRSVAFLAALRAMRIFVDLLNDVLAAEGRVGSYDRREGGVRYRCDGATMYRCVGVGESAALRSRDGCVTTMSGG